MSEGTSGFNIGDDISSLFRSFPIFTILLCITVIYILWRQTGGIERGEARREAGYDSILIASPGSVKGTEPKLFGVFDIDSSVDK